ncbi:MAG: serine hydrolase, partial [Gemmatimonadota bacterium]
LIERVPDFRLFDEYATMHANIRDLLTHRTGLSPHYDLVWLLSPTSREESFKRLKYLEPSSGFRDQFLYSNLAYLAAGTAVERLSGMSWEVIVEQRILLPLGMDHTGFTVPDSMLVGDVALPYVLVDGEPVQVPISKSVVFESVEEMGPSGGINSNVEDMARWVLLHLGQGSFRGNRLVSEAMLAEMHGPQMAIRSHYCRILAQADAYGLGWYVGDYRGHRVVSHGGNIPGFSAMVSFMPDLDVGVVVLSNSLDLLGHVISREVYDRFISGERASDWNDYFRAFYSQVEGANANARHIPRPDPEVPPPLALSSYAGEYRHLAFGPVKVEVGNGEMVLEFDSGLRSHLHHVRFNEFKGTTSEFYVPSIYVAFEVGSQGAVEALSMSVQPGTADFVFRRVENP